MRGGSSKTDVVGFIIYRNAVKPWTDCVRKASEVRRNEL